MGVYAQHDHDNMAGHGEEMQMSPKFKDKDLGAAYGHYLEVKDALVASDEEKAIDHSVMLKKALANVENADAARETASKMAGATSLEDQRGNFNALSNEMAKLVKNGKLAKGEIYLEYCPMANSNNGGYWLSNEKAIKNPYMGQKMLKCGSVKETIN
ncbi:DUF3347 domain-containing protein [Salegentibacter echinorum]|nr:DUF3347 domain-containing protein [Salegentibacter echinorum]